MSYASTRIISAPTDTLNALAYGAAPDAIQAANGSWTLPTDNSGIFESLFTLGANGKNKIVIPSGDYGVTAGIFPNGVNLSNLWIDCGPNTRFIVGKTSGSLLKILGSRDAVNVYTVYCTAPTLINTRILTLNRTDILTVGQKIAIKDNSQPILFDSTVTGLLGEINEIYSIDSSTQVTLAGETQFAYGSSTTPSLSTSIHRWWNPAQNIAIANLAFEFDPTLSYSNVGIVMDLQIMQNLILENVRINNSGFTGINLNDVIGGRVSGGSDLRVVPSDVYAVKATGASSDITIEDRDMSYGRHAFTTTNLPNGLETAFIRVKNCLARYTSLTAFDTHTGARNITFDNLTAIGSGDFGTSAGHGIGSGIALRGRFSRAQNSHIMGYYLGINFAFGQNNVADGGDIGSCQYGLGVTRHPNVEAKGIVFRNIAQSVLDIADGTVLATGAAQPGLRVYDCRLEGDCAGPVTLLEVGTMDPSWLINIYAPDATTMHSGGSFTAPSIPHDLGTVASSPLQPDPARGDYQKYKNAAAHELLPLQGSGKIYLEVENIAGAGAISAHAFNALRGDAFSATVGKKHILESVRTPAGSYLNVTYIPALKFIDAATGAGLAATLQACLDAGDATSYTGSGNWIDRSGGSPTNFAPGAAAAAPTFNGSSGGLSASEFFGFDGGDYFTYGGANAAWMQTLHKDSAAFSWAFWVKYGDISTDVQCLFGTDGNDNTKVGLQVGINAVGNRSLQVRNGTTTALSLNNPNLLGVTGSWLFMGGIVDEANNAGYFIKNGASTPIVSTYVSPSAASAAYSMQIGGAGNNQRILRAGAQLAGGWIWNSVLTPANMLALFGLTRGRFGV